MKGKPILLTTAEFAKLHGINKRTLHYYDSIQLFSPRYTGTNGYRYYDYMQSMELETILLLKELHMSLDEIKAYRKQPNEQLFLEMAEEKLQDIEQEIQQLKATKAILKQKQQQLQTIAKLPTEHIQLVYHEKEIYETIPFTFQDSDWKQIVPLIKTTWDANQYRQGIGSYIAMEKVQKQQFDVYDGLFAPKVKNHENRTSELIFNAGVCLCGYLTGDWDQLPQFYETLLAYANDQKLVLGTYAFELGMNDFAITDKTEYVTRILIPIENMRYDRTTQLFQRIKGKP